MTGDSKDRFCDTTGGEVFDFANNMEPRAVKALVEASRGKFCARITRDQGRILMLGAAAPEPGPKRTQRAPTLAAGVLGGLLALSAAAQPSPSSPPAAVHSTAGEPLKEDDPAAKNRAVALIKGPRKRPGRPRPRNANTQVQGTCGSRLKTDGSALPKRASEGR